jgi:hypothetical protein
MAMSRRIPSKIPVREGMQEYKGLVTPNQPFQKDGFQGYHEPDTLWSILMNDHNESYLLI